jgi:UDP-N-acetyl-D-glucosamine dehydrogenase
MQNILNKIESKEMLVGIIGLGYVGLPLAVEFGKAGFKVMGIDVNQDRVDQLNRGENYIQDVNSDEFSRLVESGHFWATTDYSVIKDIDAVCIAVPTPLNKTKDPDISYIMQVTDELQKYVHKGLIIVLESTTYPGTTTELLMPAIESTGLKVGEDVFLLFSPERVDPGNPIYQTKNTPKVIGGVTPNCLKLGEALYLKVIDTMVPVSSPAAAEMVKLLENTFRSINIGLANEMAIMCDKLGVDVWEVINAAATKPFGFMKFTPGPGLGGHCIPIDPLYLSWKLRTVNYRARFIELASEINSEMPNYVIDLVMRGLNKHSKSLRGSKILLMGMAYKPNIDDVRESPALDIHEMLRLEGAIVNFHDPYVSSIKFDDGMHQSVDISAESIKKYDCLVITTDHKVFDYKMLSDNAKLIVDTRNAIKDKNLNNIVSLGKPV